jgi:hypothetical protein
MRFEFARLAGAGMLSPMNGSSQNSAHPLIAKIHQLFRRDLALENDYLRQENQILRGKLGSRVPLTEADRRILVQYGLRIKDRLAEVIPIVKPETLLAWNLEPSPGTEERDVREPLGQGWTSAKS